MLGLGLSIPQVAVRGGGAAPLTLVVSGVLTGNTALTRTTTATYWGL